MTRNPREESHLLPERGRLTDHLVGVLTAFFADPNLPGDKILVGDGQIPDKAGWPGGQPDVGKFVASVTLSTGVGTPTRNPETLDARHRTWQLAYSLRSVGAARAQADDVADLARPVLVEALRGATLDLGVPWRVLDAFYPQLAPVRVTSGSDPETWEVDDQLLVLIARTRTAT